MPLKVGEHEQMEMSLAVGVLGDQKENFLGTTVFFPFSNRFLLVLFFLVMFNVWPLLRAFWGFFSRVLEQIQVTAFLGGVFFLLGFGSTERAQLPFMTPLGKREKDRTNVPKKTWAPPVGSTYTGHLAV